MPGENREAAYKAYSEQEFRIILARDVEALNQARIDNNDRMDKFDARMAKILTIGLSLLVSLTTASILLALQAGVGK